MSAGLERHPGQRPGLDRGDSVTTAELADKFVATFRKGIEAEKAALRADSTAYEVPLEQPQCLNEMGQGQRNAYSFVVPRPSERLSPGVQCSLRLPSGLEVPVTVLQLDGPRVVLEIDVSLALGEGSYRLVFVPWFLYDEMMRSLSEVSFPETALRTFGKLTSLCTPSPPLRLEHPLNDTQRAAVQQALDSQLTLLWGPPGTGKTTTLAELVAHLVRLQRRVLITSTTHAALDQVLQRLLSTPSLQPLLEANQILQLGFAGQPCSLDQLVLRTQQQAAQLLQRSQSRLETVVRQQTALLPILELSAKAASQAQQLDLFADQPGNLTALDLSQVLDPVRADALAALSAALQHQILARRARRLEALHFGLKLRARAARQALERGQQLAVNGAKILLTTLANNYVSPLLKDQQFDAVIVEEAGMALLPAVYLAAGRSREQVILVGDPQQLPAILASSDSFAQQALGRNLFGVLGARPERVMLNIQYRMHPSIGELVSQLFYSGGLTHAAPARVDDIARLPPFAGHPLVLLDLPGQALTEAGDFSRYNPVNASRAVELAGQAATQGMSVAIISPYRKQVAHIQRQLIEKGLEQQVECATVHRFQGHESDVVILDITDAPPLAPGVLLAGRGPGSASANLLNVSISRARGKLIVLCHLAYLRSRASGSVLHQLAEAIVCQGYRG